jgi:hypothetical protein
VSQEDESDKPHEATPRKLEEARKRGEIPKMADLTATAAVGGVLMLALLPGGWMPMKLGELGRGLFDHADSFSAQLLGGGAGAFSVLMGAVAVAVLPALPAAGGGGLRDAASRSAGWSSRPRSCSPSSRASRSSRTPSRSSGRRGCSSSPRAP